MVSLPVRSTTAIWITSSAEPVVTLSLPPFSCRVSGLLFGPRMVLLPLPSMMVSGPGKFDALMVIAPLAMLASTVVMPASKAACPSVMVPPPAPVTFSTSTFDTLVRSVFVVLLAVPTIRVSLLPAPPSIVSPLSIASPMSNVSFSALPVIWMSISPRAFLASLWLLWLTVNESLVSALPSTWSVVPPLVKLSVMFRVKLPELFCTNSMDSMPVTSTSMVEEPPWFCTRILSVPLPPVMVSPPSSSNQLLRNVSLPLPPTRESLPPLLAPESPSPAIVSLPVPPISVSLPSPPISVIARVRVEASMFIDVVLEPGPACASEPSMVTLVLSLSKDEVLPMV